MEKKIEVIELKDANHMVEQLKLFISAALEDCIEELLNVEIPDESDYNSKESFKQAQIDLMVQLVEEVKYIKKDIFTSILETYNLFVQEKNRFNYEATKQEQESIKTIISANSDMKRTGLLTITLSLIFPGAIPFLLVFNIPRIGSDIVSKNVHLNNIVKNTLIQNEFKRIQYPFFEFTDTLRTDYHKSMKELDKLEEEAKQGKNVAIELLEILNPERLSLPETQPLHLLEQNRPKQLQKKTNV